jgi:hypothetical protein
MTIPLVRPSSHGADGPAAVLENAGLHSCQGLLIVSFRAVLCGVPSTIEGIVKRGIDYFKPKISW